MNEYAPISGLTPSIIWNTAAGLVGLLAIALAVFKLVEFIQKQKDRKAHRDQTGDTSLTDDIVRKVMTAMEPKFDKIDLKLSADKERLDSHELRLNEHDRHYQQLRQDNTQIMDVLDGMLMHFITGNHQEQLKQVKANLDKYKNAR